MQMNTTHLQVGRGKMLHPRVVILGLLAALMVTVNFSVRAAAGDPSKAEIDGLRREIEELRRKVNTTTAPAVVKSRVDEALESKYGPNATVTTKNGKLTISGLVQVWYTTYQHDNNGLFDKAGGTAGP